MTAIGDLAKRIEDNLKLTAGPGLDTRLIFDRDSTAALAELLRTMTKLIEDHDRALGALEQIADIAEGSQTLNSLPHIARIARAALPTKSTGVNDAQV